MTLGQDIIEMLTSATKRKNAFLYPPVCIADPGLGDCVIAARNEVIYRSIYSVHEPRGIDEI